MRKKSLKAKTIQKFFSVTPMHVEMILHFIERRGMLSESDVVRQAIADFHKREFPDYVYKETPAGEQKRRNREEQEIFDATSDADYALETVKGKIVNSNSDKKYVLLHTIGNSLTAVPLEGFKNFAVNNEQDIQTHLSILPNKTIENQLSTYMINLLQSKYGIIIKPHDITQTNSVEFERAVGEDQEPKAEPATERNE